MLNSFGMNMHLCGALAGLDSAVEAGWRACTGTKGARTVESSKDMLYVWFEV